MFCLEQIASVACDTVTEHVPLHVTHCGDEHLISLSSLEASALVDACALLLLASNSTPGCKLKPEMAGVLQTVFEHFSSHVV